MCAHASRAAASRHAIGVRKVPPVSVVTPARTPFFYGWVIVAAAFCGTFIFIGVQVFALGILVKPMSADMGWSRSAIFLPLFLRGVIGALAAPFVGRLLDRPRGAHLVMTVSGVLSALSLVLAASARDETQFLLAFGLVGGLAGAGNPFIVAGAIVPKWFLRKRGRAIGLAMAGPGIAALVLPLAVTAFASSNGWRATWVALGAATFLLMALPGLLLRRQPEDMGLAPDGGSAPVGARSAPRPAASEHDYTAKQAFTTKVGWLLLLSVGLIQMSLLVLPANLVPLFVERGLSPRQAATTLLAYGITSTLARLGWGLLVEATHVRVATIVLAVFGCAVQLLLVPAVDGIAFALVLGALAGYATGGIITVTPLLWPTYFGRRHLGSIIGVVTPVTTVASNAGPLLLAQAFDRTGSYTLGLVALALAWLVGGLLVVPIKKKPAA